MATTWSRAVQTPDGFVLSAQVTGANDAPPVLLLPGQANSHLWWRELRSDFESSFRTVTFDYRGTGSSRGPVGDWSTSSFAEDAAVVLHALGIQSAHIYGTSMGGRVAQMLAILHPRLVRSQIIACSSPGGTHAVQRSAEVTRRIVNSGTSERSSVLHDLFFTPEWTPLESDALLLGDNTMSAQESAAHARASRVHDAWELLPQITAPTLVMHGEKDAMTPVTNGELIAHRIAGAEYVAYPEGRHAFFAESRRDVVGRALRHFDSAGRQ